MEAAASMIAPDMEALIEEGVPRDVMARQLERWLTEASGASLDGSSLCGHEIVRYEDHEGVVRFALEESV